MDTVLVEIITQWGLAGLVMIAAGWIIFDNYRTNKQKVNNTSLSNFDTICKMLDGFKVKQEEIVNRLTSLEKIIFKKPEETYNVEFQHMNTLVQLIPTIHSILKTSIDNCKADHIFLATFHNGLKGVTGIPFFKFDVIAERYSPVNNPKDFEMSKYYNGENISRHNKLGTILLQHTSTLFDLENDLLRNIDELEYKRCMESNVKQVVYKSIVDSQGRVSGFLCAYSFNNEINVKEFDDCVENIEEVYKNIINLME